MLALRAIAAVFRAIFTTRAVVVQRVLASAVYPPEDEFDKHRQPGRRRIREEESPAAPDAGVFLP